jgi:hypothetical protein
MARPTHEESGPVDVHQLSAEAVVVHAPNSLAQRVQGPRALQRRAEVQGFAAVL